MIDVEIGMRGTRVLIVAESQGEYQQANGLILVESHAPEVIGRVVAIGDAVCDVKAEDVVLFAPQAGTEMDFQGTKYLILDESEILAVWDEEKAPV